MSFEGNYHAALQRIVALERERDEAIRQRDAPEYMFQAAKRVRELETELADWQRMRNEAMAVATSNRARINELEALLLQMENWLRPEVVKEPDRTFFWKIVELRRKHAGLQSSTAEPIHIESDVHRKPGFPMETGKES